MNGPKSFLHVVGCEEIGNSSESVEQSVLKSKHRSWADNGCFGEDTPYDLFTSSLRAEEF